MIDSRTCSITQPCLERRLRETVTVVPMTGDVCVEKTVWNALDEDIFERITNEPSRSTRAIVHTVGIAHSTV